MIAFCLGIGLSAACGIRAFLPLLLVALNQRFNLIQTSFHLEWLDNNIVLIVLCVATIIELIAYYIPLIDHALDFIGSPLVFLVGAMSMASVIPDMPVYIDNILSIILGGSTALSMNGLMGIGRMKTTTLSAGAANPVYATLENIVSMVLTLLSFIIPVIIACLIILLVFLSLKGIRRFFNRSSRLDS